MNGVAPRGVTYVFSEVMNLSSSTAIPIPVYSFVVRSSSAVAPRVSRANDLPDNRQGRRARAAVNRFRRRT